MVNIRVGQGGRRKYAYVDGCSLSQPDEAALKDVLTYIIVSFVCSSMGLPFIACAEETKQEFEVETNKATCDKDNTRRDAPTSYVIKIT